MDAGLIKGEGFAIDASVMEADASRYHGKAPGEIDWSLPERQTRAAAEFLGGLEDEDPDANRKLPKAISPSDPCSAWTAKANKRVQFGYGLNYMIDVEHAVIVDVEATPARTYDEVAATRTMIDRTETTFGLKPGRLAADTAYGTGKLLAWLLDKDITPHIPVKEGYERTDGMFPRLDFAYDAARDIYICPNGRPLRTSGTVHDGRARNYLSHPGDCRVCKLKKQCTRAPFRKIARDINEKARDHARSFTGTPEFDQSSNQRKKVEMRFAHLKTHHRFERTRLRGLSGARDEFHLAATVQNLKTLANYLWAITVECGGGLRHLSKIVVACPSHVNNIAASQGQQRGKPNRQTVNQRSRQAHRRLINGIDPTASRDRGGVSIPAPTFFISC